MEEPTHLVARRFKCLRPLSARPGLMTHFARDTRTGREVVLRLAGGTGLSDSGRDQLRREARILSELGIAAAGCLEVGQEDGQLYLVFPYTPGRSLKERLAMGPLSVDETLAVAESLLHCLERAHDRGILHQDIKPSNVIVPEGRVDRATLIDFGMAFLAGTEQEGVDGAIGGSLAYLAPEQVGLVSEPQDGRSDLFSVGVTLYECLDGNRPFSARGVRELLQELLTVHPPPLRGRLPVPRALDDVIQRLLRKDPRDRYQTARAALQDVREIRRARAEGQEDPALVVGRHDPRATLTEPAFVEREAPLSELGHWFAAGREAAGLFTLEAYSGEGKSRLLDEFSRRARREGAVVFRGQAYDRVAARPFEVFAGVVDEVVKLATAEPMVRARLARRLAPHAPILLRVFPQLVCLFPGLPVAELGPEEFAETRSVGALVAFLSSLGSKKRPALVVLDDLQWARGLSLKVLEAWAQLVSDPDGTKPCVLVAAAFRTEEVGPQHPLRRLRGGRSLRLDPLSSEEVTKLLDSMAGSLPRAVHESVSDWSGGNPFLAAALLRGLVESGALRHHSGQWTYLPPETVSPQSSQQAAALLARRIVLLPSSVREALRIAAVLGREFEREWVQELAREVDVASALEEARRRHILWARPQVGRYLFAHDKLRETCLALMPEPEQRRLHLAAGKMLERRHPSRAFEIAYHLGAAGQFERALPFALGSAREARAQHSLEIAEQQYRLAERGSRAAGLAVRREALEGLGDVLMLRGAYEEAKRWFDEAMTLASSGVEQATIEAKIGELAFRRGDMTEAARYLEQALARLGSSVPTGPAGVWALLLKEVVVQAAHTLFPRWFVHRRREAPSERELLIVGIHSRLAYTYWFTKGAASCAWAHLKEMNRIERYPVSRALGQAYSEHAVVCTLIPWIRRALRYAEKGLEARRRLNDLWGQGQSLHFYGVALYTASRYAECIDRCREAVGLMARLGDRWEESTAGWHIALCHYRRGELAEAVEVSRRIVDRASRIGDHQSARVSLAIWAKAAEGDVSLPWIDSELSAAGDDLHTRAELIQAKAVCLLHEGRSREAVDVLEAGCRSILDRGFRSEYVLSLRAWLATALRHEVERARRSITGGDFSRRLRRARRAARQAVRLAKRYRNNLPQALREAGWLEAMSGRPERAIRLLESSVAEAKRQGARGEMAESKLALGRLGRELGRPGAESLEKEGEAELSAIRARRNGALPERPSSASLADRLRGVLEAGRAIASSLTRAEVLEILHRSALQTLRGEGCCLFAREEGSAPRAIFGGSADALSRELARRALEEKRPVCFVEGAGEDASDSVLLASVRSALAAPIRVRGDYSLGLYVWHRSLRSLYGEQEVLLAEFLAAVAGAALENAENFDRLKTLNQELKANIVEKDEVQRQLEAAKEAAVIASNAKSEFIANVSHEMRTPLSAILGYTELLALVTEGPQRDQCLARIQENIKGLTELVDDILDISKIEARKIEVRPREFSLISLLGELTQQFRREATAKGLSFRMAVEGEVPDQVTTDPARLRQILVNLLGNAIKFTDRGSVQLSVSAEPQSAEVSRLRITVKDTGPGVPSDLVPRLFQAFERGRGREGTVVRGCGLGLAISRRLAEVLGGSIALKESEGSRGATFEAVLPVRHAPKAKPDLFSKPALDSGEGLALSPSERELDGRRILVAEDDPDNREILRLLLEEHGAEVGLAEDGFAAVEMARRTPFDLILMDVRMPRLDGYEATRALREAGFRAPILALTAHAMTGEREKCLASGCDGFLTKPICVNSLLAAVRAAWR